MVRLSLLALLALGGCITHAPSLVVSRPDNQVDTAVTAMWSHDVHAVVQDGDWILTRSYTAVGDAITGVTAGDVSHSQIYDAQHDAVIEANGEGVHETKLDQVIASNHYLVVVRPHMTAAERTHAVERARTRIGAGYDYTGLLGIDDPNRLYCSELVWWAAQGEMRTGDHYVVIAPTDLMKYGDVIYISGTRDNRQVMANAMSREHFAAR